ncbi:hypothetical protein O6H91_01G159800 [Diphasiastrum complanatum]|uniref:Uncharacterized protein n=1 Tax=Diphasiastrum complanatum TaxID=34168 RepID=A0ACC2EXT5_DIPCM|nr:hypothetical protein O6H91_01G159800 [Diphasiastrum complanatum]
MLFFLSLWTTFGRSHTVGTGHRQTSEVGWPQAEIRDLICPWFPAMTEYNSSEGLWAVEGRMQGRQASGRVHSTNVEVVEQQQGPKMPGFSL